MKTHRLFPLLAALIVSLLTSGTSHAQKAPRQTAKPRPDLVKVHYGDHERQVLDFWKAKSDKPTPLVVFIHGGGFRAVGLLWSQHRARQTVRLDAIM